MVTLIQGRIFIEFTNGVKICFGTDKDIEIEP